MFDKCAISVIDTRKSHAQSLRINVRADRHSNKHTEKHTSKCSQNNRHNHKRTHKTHRNSHERIQKKMHTNAQTQIHRHTQLYTQKYTQTHAYTTTEMHAENYMQKPNHIHNYILIQIIQPYRTYSHAKNTQTCIKHAHKTNAYAKHTHLLTDKPTRSYTHKHRKHTHKTNTPARGTDTKYTLQNIYAWTTHAGTHECNTHIPTYKTHKPNRKHIHTKPHVRPRDSAGGFKLPIN